MNDHIGSIVCPNCGASSSNRQKCDFCGSVLVRYADKNIKNLDEKFGKSVKTIAGLNRALERNLAMQESSKQECLVITRIFPSEENRKDPQNIDLWKRIRQTESHPKKESYAGPFIPFDKTALWYDSYEIIASRDANFGSTRFDCPSDIIGLTLRIPFANERSFIHKFKLGTIDGNSDLSFDSAKTIFNDWIDKEGMFRVEKYNGGCFMLLDLGQDVESAARIITYYIKQFEKRGRRYGGTPDIYSFDPETIVIDKELIALDVDGAIVEKKKLSDKTNDKKEQSLWRKLFG